MNILKQTPAGTIGAYSYEQDGNKGIAIGFVDKENHKVIGKVFLEVDSEGNTKAIVESGERKESFILKTT